MVTLLRQHQAAASTPVRVLLLARPAGGWWQSLVYQLSTLTIDNVGEWALTPLAERSPDRQAIYVAARDRFAAVLGLAAPTGAAGPDLGGPQFELVLAVHMKALVDVDAATRGIRPPSGRDQAGLSSYLLDREHDYWRAAHHEGTGPVRTSELGMSRAVYTATLTRTLPHSDGVTALTRAKIGEATTQPVSQVLADHTVLYPPADPDTVLEPLYPDRLGEDFIALTTPGHTDTGHSRIEPWATTLPAQLLTTDDGDGPVPPYARAAITTLVEAARRWPHLAERQLYPILRQRPRLALAAGGAALTRLADLQHPGILDILQAIEPHLPGRHVDLDTGIAALITRLTTHYLTTTTDPAYHAQLYVTLYYRLANAGHHDQALTAATNAVEICRWLAGGNPVAFDPNLALALNNLGMTLSDLGRREEALDAATEALEIRRRLAGVNPAAFDADLATALNNLSVHLAELGRREEALTATTEAVQISRRLAGTNPAAFDSDFAAALNNLGVRLSSLGRREEALTATTEAVQISRRLAGTNPAAFDPGFARALANLGVELSDLGRREEALTATTEAVQISRRLAGTNPAAFDPGFARALANLGVELSDLGRHGEALTATTEAVQIYRRLAAVNPAAFDSGLAMVLNNLGNRMSHLARHGEALTATTEAVQIYRRLAAVTPAAFDPDFARALTNLSGHLSSLGRREEALAPTTEAVQIYRRLAAVNPDAFDPNLAHGLWSFAWVRAAGQVELPQALTAADESVAIYGRLVQRLPEAFTSDLQGVLATIDDVHTALTTQQKTAAVGPRTPKVSLFRRWLRRS